MACPMATMTTRTTDRYHQIKLTVRILTIELICTVVLVQMPRLARTYDTGYDENNVSWLKMESAAEASRDRFHLWTWPFACWLKEKLSLIRFYFLFGAVLYTSRLPLATEINLDKKEKNNRRHQRQKTG